MIYRTKHPVSTRFNPGCSIAGLWYDILIPAGAEVIKIGDRGYALRDPRVAVNPNWSPFMRDGFLQEAVNRYVWVDAEHVDAPAGAST